MNSYRRPRSRPRKNSVNFRTFGWLLQREAAFYVLARTLWAAEPPMFARRELCNANRHQLVEWFERAYAVYVRMEVYR